jgi:hypothetical protein
MSEFVLYLVFGIGVCICMSLGALPWLGAAVGIWSATQQAKAQKSATNAQMNLAQPTLAAQQFALPQMRDLVETQMLPSLGKDSIALEGAHLQSLDDINSAEAHATDAAEFTAGRTGNTGLATGEKFRIGMGASKARGGENTTYALNQENFKQGAVNRTFDALSSIAGLGQGGANMAANAIQGQNAATQEMYGGIAGLGGRLFGYGLDKWGKKK